MAKSFAPRVSKKQRKTIDMTDKLNRDLLSMSNDQLLKGATLSEVKLKNVNVKEQVRTKFNDASLKELAKNIQENGLIQPIVLHKNKGKYNLICGERRFRAMSLNQMECAPCFVLEGKTEKELMAIQFSENSSREELHYIDKADGIYNYQKATKASERKIQVALGISKSEVHRSLMIAKLPAIIKEAAKQFDIEKYVLVEFDALENGAFRKKIEKQILAGEIKKRAELKRAVKNGGVIQTGKQKKSAALPTGMTANALLKMMNSRVGDLDEDTQKIFKKLVKDTKQMADLQ
ncbi:MAG: ParB/RepB/Spo0J family partition protein [Bacteriovoracaceae bacterium]|nr:ParB/RepB/Spo0J family partition protein [Bacteriovoracaceae bacterium]